MKDPHQVEGERIVAMLGRALNEELEDITTGPPMGFALWVFDFGDGGFLSYISNARREDMIKLMRELLARLEAGCN